MHKGKYVFSRLSNRESLRDIESIGAYFVIRGKTNNVFKPMKLKRRFPPESGIQSDAIGYMIAELYHNRWQIVLFFKWIKQHQKIKEFWGTSENAVRIQIYFAIIAYNMMAIVQKKMNIERPIYEMLVIVSISFTDTISLKDLFAKPNYNIINELDGSTEPTLF